MMRHQFIAKNNIDVDAVINVIRVHTMTNADSLILKIMIFQPLYCPIGY